VWSGRPTSTQGDWDQVFFIKLKFKLISSSIDFNKVISQIQP
jgi:hypothetical protein